MIKKELITTTRLCQYRHCQKIIPPESPAKRRYCNDACQQAEYRERLRDAGKLKPRQAGRISALFATLLFLTVLLAAALMMGCSALDYNPFDALHTATAHSAQILSTQTAQLQPVSTETPAEVITCSVTAPEALNLRAGPGIQYSVTTWLHAGEILTLTGSPAQGHWFEVTTQAGERGWVNSNYCKGK